MFRIICFFFRFCSLFVSHYPTRFGRVSFRPYDSGKEVNLVTIPSGPNTFDGILSKESDNERESELSCILKIGIREKERETTLVYT